MGRTRDVPETGLHPWDPPTYRVGPDGKVEGAEPGQPNNWGRWGPDDQKGTLNLLTPERVAAAARLVRTGERFPLAIPIGPPAPGYRPAPLHLFGYTGADSILGDSQTPGIDVSDDYIVMALQASTQLDGLSHFGTDGFLYNGYWAGLVSARSGARRLGIHHLAEGIAGRGVLLDVAGHLGVERLEEGFAIGADLLDATAAAQGVEVGAGDIVLVRTGQLGWWYSLEDKSQYTGNEPGLDPRSLPWFADRDVVLVGTDTLAVEVIVHEPGLFVGFHRGALRDLGMLLAEILDLDALAADCAGDGIYEFFFVAAPLPVVNGVGSPINPLAIK